MYRFLTSNGISLKPYTSLMDCFGFGSDYTKLLKVPIHLKPGNKFEFDYVISFDWN